MPTYSLIDLDWMIENVKAYKFIENKIGDI